MTAKRVGVLALQGDVREHTSVLQQLDCQVVEVKTLKALAAIDGLVIPGGESTTIYKLSEIFGLFQPIKDAIAGGLPVFGTCAGLIMLSNTIHNSASGQKPFGGIDAVVERNAFGNQNDSFEIDLTVKGIPEPIHAAFIRAPIIESVGPAVEVIAELPDGRIVGVRQGNAMAISFHPEVVGETRVHELFLRSIA
ncbi:MAG: pyridoxal 5'-phosphate synthase glutaminase subunit PdxT [Micrococcales bacterium]